MSYLGNETEFHIIKSDDGNCFFEMGSEEVVDVFTETTGDRVIKKENGDKYIDIGLHGEKPYGIHELQYAVTQNPFLGCDYHIERGEEIAFAKNLNKYVDVDDHFIFLGDFDSRHSTPDFDRLKKFFANIKCRNVYLILGNNDSFPVKKYKELGIRAVVDKFEFGNCILTHFPVMVKAPMINIHGHLHGAASHTQKGEKAYWYADPKRCVDAWRDDYSPVRLNDVLANWKELKKYKSYSDGKIMKLLLEDKDGDDYTNYSDQKEVFEENVLISRDDIYYDFDKFESGQKNVLLITGFSGSGKSTLAEQLSSKYNCDYFMLDSLENYGTGHVSLDNLKQGEEGCHQFLITHPKIKDTLDGDYTKKEFWSILCKYIPWLISWCKKQKNQRFIIEGLQLYETISEGSVSNTILKNPFIIKGTSGLKSAWRAGKRAGGKELPAEFLKHIKWAFRDNKMIEALKKALDKVYMESDEDEFIGVKNMNKFERYISESFPDSISEKTYMTEEAKYDKKNKYPVYIILTDADSPMAKMIKKYTGQDWAHALIAFNSDLEPAYSFGCTSIKPMKFGFISKSEEDPFRDQEKAKYEVLLMYVNKMQYDKMQKKLNWYLTHKEDLKYSFSGLGFFGLNIPKHIKDKYFCSQFVMDIIGEAFTISKDPSLWSPGDIENLDNLSIIDKGNDLRYFDKKSLVKNTKFVQKGLYNKIHFNESVEDEDIFEEAGDPAKTHYFLENVGKRVDKAFEDPKTAREFNKLVSNYINRNIDKLTKSGPCDMIPFTDNEHKAFQELFGFWYEIDNRPKKTSPNEIRDLIITYQKENKIKVDYWLNNSSQILFYFVIRYFTMKKDSKSLNNALAIYALCVYPVMFHKYFPYGVMEPFMQYTIDHLTDKFIIKRSKHLFDALMQSIQNSYKFHKNNFAPASDKNMTDWTHRIRNDQNSLLKKISNEYMYNWKHGNAARTQNEEYDDSTPIVDEIENGTTVVQNIVNKVTLPIIEDGVDLRLSAAAAKMANVGVSDCRFFLTEIIVNDNLETLQRFIEAILFLYIYEEKKGERDIRSQYFIAWAVSLFKKTNSKNENIGTINAILNEWAVKSGIDDKFSRVASRINYKKAIFFYIILSIQKNI